MNAILAKSSGTPQTRWAQRKKQRIIICKKTQNQKPERSAFINWAFYIDKC